MPKGTTSPNAQFPAANVASPGTRKKDVGTISPHKFIATSAKPRDTTAPSAQFPAGSAASPGTRKKNVGTKFIVATSAMPKGTTSPSAQFPAGNAASQATGLPDARSSRRVSHLSNVTLLPLIPLFLRNRKALRRPLPYKRSRQTLPLRLRSFAPSAKTKATELKVAGCPASSVPRQATRLLTARKI